MSNLVQSICWIVNVRLSHIHETVHFTGHAVYRAKMGGKSLNLFPSSQITCKQIISLKKIKY